MADNQRHRIKNLLQKLNDEDRNSLCSSTSKSGGSNKSGGSGKSSGGKKGSILYNIGKKTGFL